MSARTQAPITWAIGFWQPASAGARSTSGTGAATISVKSAEAAGIRPADPKWFDPGGYARWRGLVLCGVGLDGRDARDWRGRNSERDVAFADLLYGAGLRLQEGGSLLVIELPRLTRERDYFTCRLAAACAKGGRGRPYWMPFSARDALDQYIGPEGERSRAVQRAQVTGATSARLDSCCWKAQAAAR